MKNQNLKLTMSAITFMVLTSACGPQGRSIVASSLDNSSSATSDISTSTSKADVSTTVGSNLLPPLTQSFSVSGPNGSTPTFTTGGITTDNLLKVTVIANSFGSIKDSNQAVGYNCVRFNVTVKPKNASSGQTQSVLVSLTGKTGTGSCSGANPQPTLDFSSMMTSGHGEMVVSVSATTSDNCRKYFFQTSAFSGTYGVGFGGCPLDVIYSTYMVPATIQVYTNGTI